MQQFTNETWEESSPEERAAQTEALMHLSRQKTQAEKDEYARQTDEQCAVRYAAMTPTQLRADARMWTGMGLPPKEGVWHRRRKDGKWVPERTPVRARGAASTVVRTVPRQRGAGRPAVRGASRRS